MKQRPDEAPTESNVPVDRKIVLAETLRRRIVSMELQPGAVVDELALCDEFGLSRPPVRELMRQMAAEGYIELEANRAARVSSMSYHSLRSFFLAAPLIYVATTQLAAANATAADVARLKEIQRRFRLAIDEHDVDNRVLYNDQFHLEIGKMAQNDYLMPSLRRLLIDHARLGKTFYRYPASENMQHEMHQAADQHDEIIDAIAQHNAERAGELVKAHWELSRRHMTDYAIPEGLEIPLSFA
ncbi:GntR family transcriptional regulator [Paraburkholderia sp. J67]|uniref:GntR family transcriptional regulator n=1 Tax=Paraburkholderia sp. J67 TaxID=2805435 RepID=UPI002ABE06D4|nr:GntR family transcriptional regulator [Paraburkholderia sp. J67]